MHSIGLAVVAGESAALSRRMSTVCEAGAAGGLRRADDDRDAEEDVRQRDVCGRCNCTGPAAAGPTRNGLGCRYGRWQDELVLDRDEDGRLVERALHRFVLVCNSLPRLRT